jgi:hypothetical protein
MTRHTEAALARRIRQALRSEIVLMPDEEAAVVVALLRRLRAPAKRR